MSNNTTTTRTAAAPTAPTAAAPSVVTRAKVKKTAQPNTGVRFNPETGCVHLVSSSARGIKVSVEQLVRDRKTKEFPRHDWHEQAWKCLVDSPMGRDHVAAAEQKLASEALYKRNAVRADRVDAAFRAGTNPFAAFFAAQEEPVVTADPVEQATTAAVKQAQTAFERQGTLPDLKALKAIAEAASDHGDRRVASAFKGLRRVMKVEAQRLAEAGDILQADAIRAALKAAGYEA